MLLGGTAGKRVVPYREIGGARKRVRGLGFNISAPSPSHLSWEGVKPDLFTFVNKSFIGADSLLGTISGMNLKIKYVIKDVDRYGLVRWYYRQPGCAKVRLPSPEHPNFFEELSKAKAAASQMPSPADTIDGSLRWLCLAYIDSADFTRELSKSTREVRKRILDRICQEQGFKPFKTYDSGDVMKLRDKWAKDGPEAGNSAVKALRQVFKWAKAAKHVKTNEAKEVEYLSSDNPDGFYTWTPEDIAQFIAKHPLGTKPYLALMLLMYGGGRRSDVVRLGRQMVKDQSFHYVAWKGRGKKRTRTERFVPIVPPLQEAIDLTPTGELVYLLTALGKPFTSNGFGNWFKDRCVEAELPHCSCHGLRKASAVSAAEAGCSEWEMMALFGWASPKQAAVYTRKVNTSKLAQSGTAKIVQLMPRKKSNSEIA
jgi:integrase